jgi:hypothetical protein
MPTLASLTFNTADLRQVSSAPGAAAPRTVWMSPEGDGVSLNYFPKPPDLPANLPSVPALGQFYQRMLRNSPTKLVSVWMPRVAGCPAVELVFKAPQQPAGLTYVGTLTLPFRDFSFVLKVQCEERGTTGTREAVLFDKLMKSGEITFDPPNPPANFHPDDPRYDAEFPGHPLSRLRKLLRHIESTAMLDEATRAEPGFPLPA